MTRPGFDGPTVTIERAAELLHCSRSRVFELLKEGRLTRAPKHGRQTVIHTTTVLVVAMQPETTAPKRQRSRRLKLAAAFDAIPRPV